MFKDCLTLVSTTCRMYRFWRDCNSLFISSFGFHGTCVCIDSSWVIRRRRRIDMTHKKNKKKTLYWCGTPMVKVNVYTFSYKNYTTSQLHTREKNTVRGEIPLWTCMLSSWQETCLCSTVITFNPCFRLYDIIMQRVKKNFSRRLQNLRTVKWIYGARALKFTFLDQLSTNY